MFPGTTTKLSETTVPSAASITQTADIMRVTGSTQINTIVPNFGGGFSGICILVPVTGALVLGTSGNILIGATAPLNRATMMVFSKTDQKWYPGAIS